jgi:tetratricopeptide (TPR) repeat protein
MPQVVNGCGTWYYGKKNKHQYQGVCRACGHHATLTSYDTRLYVVVIMIPVIPLAKKRIVEECSVCQRHFAIPWREWDTARNRAREMIETYRQSPHNGELAREAIGAAVSYRDVNTFLEFAPEIERNLARDAKTLRLLGAAHDAFARTDDAERLFRAALAADEEDDDTAEALADILIRQGKPEEAEPYLRHIVEDGIPDRIDGLFQLAQGYQAKGEHEKALEAFRQCEQVNPLIAQDENFIRLRDASQAKLGTREAVRPAEVVRKARSAVTRKKSMKVGAVVVLLAVIAYLAIAWAIGMRRQVFLVSGLDRPYTVRINNDTHTLHAGGVQKVRIPEGQLKIEFVDAPFPVPPETVNVRTPFFSRPFTSHSIVVNPDRAAVVQKVTAYYVPRSSGRTNPDPSISLAAGRALHHYTGIDHPFEDFPERLTTKQRDGQVTRQGLALLRPDQRMQKYYLLLNLITTIGQETAAEIARRHLLLEPEEHEYLAVLQTTATPEQMAQFLRQGLSRRPILMQWHRSYQYMMERTGKHADVEREYDQMLAADPQNKDLMYLAGRAAADLEKNLSLNRKAAEGADACPYALYSLASYHLANGEFPQAVDLVSRAVKLLPKADEIRVYQKHALHAAGRYDELLAVVATEQTKPFPYSLIGFTDEAYIHTVRGQAVRAKDAIDRMSRHLTATAGPQYASQQVGHLQAILDYVKGDVAKFSKALSASDDAPDQFSAHVAANDLAAAEKAVPKLRQVSAEHHLILYLLASQQAKRDAADKHVNSAIALLEKADRDDRPFAAALKGQPDRPLDQLLRLRGPPNEKVLRLTALGLRDPAAREKCFALARKLNFDKRFPHLLIKQVLDDGGAKR